MIVGFSHVIVGCVHNNRFATYKDIPSSKEKWPLLGGKAYLHDITIFNDQVPVEIITHDTGFSQGKSRIAICGKAYIKVFAREPETEKAFLSKLGIVNNGCVQIASAVPNWKMNIDICEAAYAPIDPKLDIMGYAALAFYTNKIASDRDALISAGGRMATTIFPVDLGKRRLSVCMMRSPEGTIIELVEVNQ